jgi:hypothetical protein
MAAISPEEYRQQALDLAQGALPPGGTLRLTVVSDSMTPLLLPGDGVLVAQAAEAELRLGDLIVVRRAGELVTHRVVGRACGRWLTKGDNLRTLDPPVVSSDLIGRVVAIERQSARTDLETGRWRRVNGLLGWLSWWEARVYRAARRVSGGTTAGASLFRFFIVRPAAALRRWLYRGAGER